MNPESTMKRSTATSSFLILISLLYFLLYLANATHDTFTTTQLFRDGDTLVSSGQIFEFGFFSPGKSKNRYVGIWFKNKTVESIVWVANRGVPIRDTTSVVLKVTPSGQLIIQDQSRDNNTIIWSSLSSKVDARNPVVQLLDTGNLVVREADSTTDKSYLWQSFDYPSDTYLSGMYFGVNLVTGKQIYLTSWRSSEDPALGDFTISLDVTGYPQTITKRGANMMDRLGPWNGIHFSGTPNVKGNSSTETLIMNSSVVYFRKFAIGNMFQRFALSPDGVGRYYEWVNRSNDWVVFYKFPADICDHYGTCGAHGSCNNANLPVCGCLERFEPRNSVNWALSDWSGGCVRRTPLHCTNDVFLKYSGLKMPDARITRYNESLSLGECEEVCLRNCSCTAYSNLDISRASGSGCLLWFGDLVDMRHLSGEAQDIYIRLAASELLGATSELLGDSYGRKRTILIAVLASLVGIVLLGLSVASFIWERKKNDEKLTKEESNFKDLELPLFDLSTISKATNNFSNNNKLGEGGFGSVYKGMLDDGKEIAVKRLSRTSKQGIDEFKNEIICIAKLQHRNLVKLVGCCIKKDEKMLIYEYMSNKSLDFILFDKTKAKQLDWPKRFHVINGIARGLVYLHQDSRVRIIHRDLKASNILLDDELNPKISDFGLARIFGGNVIEVNTERVAGTYGYMSPEYAGYGLCSLKSDVYSFGVLVLEIVSGHRSGDFHHAYHHHNLIGHAWVLYKEGRTLELVDPSIVSFDHSYMLKRSIHIALLCVQQLQDKRPSMNSVVLMLGSEGVLPEPRQPGFFTTFKGDSSLWSNENTITQIETR